MQKGEGWQAVRQGGHWQALTASLELGLAVSCPHKDPAGKPAESSRELGRLEASLGLLDAPPAELGQRFTLACGPDTWRSEAASSLNAWAHTASGGTDWVEDLPVRNLYWCVVDIQPAMP